ncbi:toxin-antitoxin system HicB family antitoxin [Nannocystis sp. RBIL2]|uniref:toxin-antitoxin system HicB family antitoxin n=1 Tax=Nannocystis sp. RBIL2 TaxID=2996788 RepID=UPI00226E50B4|nr:toxin-antitoxin system HicB family antitoxin [Nannocystis sp. RBIL2]MCY1068104.1 toxin-antitoxin system HicB family antitoxin [Nannocystis sp. RBIL2]
MVEKKRFLLRIDPELHAALERWAADDLRSINGQIEFVLKEAVRTAGRLKDRPTDPYRTSEDEE